MNSKTDDLQKQNLRVPVERYMFEMKESLESFLSSYNNPLRAEAFKFFLASFKKLVIDAGASAFIRDEYEKVISDHIQKAIYLLNREQPILAFVEERRGPVTYKNKPSLSTYEKMFLDKKEAGGNNLSQEDVLSLIIELHEIVMLMQEKGLSHIQPFNYKPLHDLTFSIFLKEQEKIGRMKRAESKRKMEKYKTHSLISYLPLEGQENIRKIRNRFRKILNVFKK